MRTFVHSLVLILSLGAFFPSLAAQSARPIYVYVTDSTPGGQGIVYVFKVDPATGGLTPVSGSPFAAGSFPGAVAADPTGRFVYVANSNSNDISAYSVDTSTGALTPIPGSPFLAHESPATVSVDPTGRYLYVGNVLSGDLSLYSIDDITGVLVPITGSPFAFGDYLSAIVFSPNGNQVYLGESGHSMLVESLNFATGVPSQIQSLPYNSIYSIVFGAGGKFSYAAAPNPSGTVNAFSVSSADGTLMALPAPNYPVGPFPTAMAVNPAGSFLFVANENFSYQAANPPSSYNGSISAFVIDPEIGGLTPIPGSPFSAAINSFDIVADPSGHFVYVLAITGAIGNLEFPGILGFSVDPSTGALSPLPGSPLVLPTFNTQRIAISFGPLGLSNPVPMISSISPSSATAGGPGFTLQVNGVNFVSGAVVYIGGQARATTFVNSTQLNAEILSSDIADGGTGVVYVFNPLPGGGASTSVGFSVFNPSPVISSINPASVVAGGPGFTLNVNGSNFVSSSIVNFNGAARATAFSGPTQLTMAVSASDIPNQGSVAITVTNPANGVAGGGTSDALALTILPASVQPVVGTLLPASATAGGPGFNLTVSGSGFTPASIVSFNLNDMPTTYVSSTQLMAAIPASAIAVAGDPVVIVTNPGVGVSLLATFVVNNPPPGAGTVIPPSLPAGSAALTLNVTGTNFTMSSTVLVNGSSRITTYLSSTLLQAALLPSDLSHGGTLNITVSTPPPGGGSTAVINLTVVDYAVTPPAMPTSVSAGQPAVFVLSIAPSSGTFSDPVTFTASGLPAGAGGSFLPSATITPGGSPSSVTLSITTTPHSLADVLFFPFRRAPGSPKSGYWLLVVCFVLGLGWRGMRATATRLTPRLVLASLLLAAGCMSACGTSGGGVSTGQQFNPETGTPAGTYTIVVTATSGGIAHSTDVMLTVI